MTGSSHRYVFQSADYSICGKPTKRTSTVVAKPARSRTVRRGPPRALPWRSGVTRYVPVASRTLNRAFAFDLTTIVLAGVAARATVKRASGNGCHGLQGGSVVGPGQPKEICVVPRRTPVACAALREVVLARPAIATTAATAIIFMVL